MRLIVGQVPFYMLQHSEVNRLGGLRRPGTERREGCIIILVMWASCHAQTA